jgi:hypothetical protein
MKRGQILIILVVFLLFSLVIISAEELPTVKIVDEGLITTVRTSDGLPLSPIVMQNKLTAYTEVAPIIVGNKIFVSTGWTYSADYDSVNANFIENPNAFKQKFLNTDKLVYGGDTWVDNSANLPIMRSAQNNNILSAQEFKDVPFWRATYGGIWEVEKVNNKFFGIIHGEQGNHLVNGICYQDNIHPNVHCETCRYEPGVGDCPTSYSSFLAGGYSNNLDGTGFIDEGPIVWPADGYTPYKISGNSWDLGWGVRHGNSIIKDNYLYMFYQDWSGGDPKNGRGIGMKVARAPLNNLHAGYFETWYKLADGTEGWEPSLPEEFWSDSFYIKGKNVWNENYKDTSQEWIDVNGCTMWNYGNGWLDRGEKRGFQCFNNINDYSIKGGKSSGLFGTHYVDSEQHYNEWPLIYDGKAKYQFGSGFSVAKIKGTDYYLGIEDSASGFDPKINGEWFNYWVGLRISKDLIHWSDPIILEDTIVHNWPDLKLGHPDLLNGDFKTNNEIDPNGFYIVGSHTRGDGSWRVQQLNYKWLKINLEEENTETLACSSFTYSPWTTCNPSALQSRTIISSNPSGCTGGTPENLIQQCSPPCLLSNWQSSDSACLSSNTLTRTWTKIGNCNQTIGISKSNSETISCTYVPNVVTCTNFTYSNWGECFSNGIQNRSLTNSSPTNCQAGNPILTQACNYTAQIINPDITINPNENQGDNSGAENNNQETDNQNPAEGGETTQPLNNKTPEETINLNETNKETNSLKKFFIKLICKFSHLFNEEKYNSCITKHLE